MKFLKQSFAWTRDVLPLFRINYPERNSLKTKVRIVLTSFRLHVKKHWRMKEGSIHTEKVMEFRFSTFNRYTLMFLYDEIFLRSEYFFSLPATKEPIIIDIGGNIGMATVYFKWLFPQCRVYVFEPDPQTFSLLRKNIEQNKLIGVECYNSAVSNSEGSVPFYIDEKNPGVLMMSIREGRIHEGTRINVKTIALSSFLSKNKVSHIDLLKIDAEGSEWEIVKDLQDHNVLNIADKIIVEYHHQIGGEPSRLSDFLKMFEDAGFDYHVHGYALPGIFESRFQDVLIFFYKRHGIKS